MNRRKLCALFAVLGLAATSLLLAFLLLGQSKVTVAHGRSALIADLAVSRMVFTTNSVAPLEKSYVCSSAWVTQTVDSAGDVGRPTSLALEPTYPFTPHISYNDVTSSSLKHAWLNGKTWLSETVDFPGVEYISLALVPTYPYTPCISYHSYEGWYLRYACRDGITWTIVALSSGMRVGLGGTSLAMEPTYPYTPHISSYNPWATIRTLYHTYLSGTVWMSGTWKHEQIEPLLSRAGTWNSLALEVTYPYTPHISYYNGMSDDLKHAWLNGTTWLSETVDSGGDVGWYTSLALDSSGNPHISHVDNTSKTLKYAWLSGTTWFSETVTGIGNSPYYGSGTSLKLNQNDTPYISYYDAISDDLKLAYFNGSVWISQTVDSIGDVGPYSSLALDQYGCPHISYYDATNGDLKYAYVPIMPVADFAAWPIAGKNPLTVVFTNTSIGNYTTSLWDFGDEITSTLESPTHTYTESGAYTVALTVSGLGGSDTKTKTEYVKVDYIVYLPITMKNYQ